MIDNDFSIPKTKLIRGIFNNPVRYKILSELEYSTIVYDSKEKKYFEIDFLNSFKKDGITHIDEPKINNLDLLVSLKINEANIYNEITSFVLGYKYKNNLILVNDMVDNCIYWFRKEA